MFRPRQDHILVKPVPWRQSKVLEVISHDRYSRAVVIACGPGEWILNKHGRRRFFRPVEVKPGDYIVYGFDHIFPKYEEAGIEYRILQDKDVCFISDPDFIDAHSALTDAQIEAMIRAHNKPLELAA